MRVATAAGREQLPEPQGASLMRIFLMKSDRKARGRIALHPFIVEHKEFSRDFFLFS
jgi:hypothetical protein